MLKAAKSFLSIYKPCCEGPVILFASPRGGSTWASELIASQPGFWPVSEPLNVRLPWVRQRLGLDSFGALYGQSADKHIRDYYKNIFAGRYPELKLRPGQPYYHPITRRIVVKENQGGLDRIPWFEDSFNANIIHLLRHPIAVALSREVFPLLADFQSCALRERFTVDQLRLADDLIAHGNHLQQGVLAWCLHHVPALQDRRPTWVQLTYEQTLLHPTAVIKELAEKLHLPDTARMLEQISKPSLVTRKSDPATRALLEQGADAQALICKWLPRVSLNERKRVEDILQVFTVKLYSAHQPEPQLQIRRL